MSYIESATNDIAAHQHAGMLVVLESTTYPGTTREVIAPLLTRGYELGRDVFIAFSPERVDPGNKVFHTRNTPKVMGGMTQECFTVAKSLYSRAIDTIVKMSSVEAAEMVKILENTFRAVNIALINELVKVSRSLGVDICEVVDGAASKPFGFMPFYPGPGVGGHCIPVDPQYLSWKLRTLGHESRFIDLAEQVNLSMPHHVVHRAEHVLEQRGRALRGASVAVLGVAYKPGVGDMRESPSVEVFDLLIAAGAQVSYVDPHVPQFESERFGSFESRPLDESLADHDLVVITTHHDEFDYRRLALEAKAILDTRGVMRKRAPGHGTNVFSL